MKLSSWNFRVRRMHIQWNGDIEGSLWDILVGYYDIRKDERKNMKIYTSYLW
jgi:hypothetical protein